MRSTSSAPTYFDHATRQTMALTPNGPTPLPATNARRSSLQARIAEAPEAAPRATTDYAGPEQAFEAALAEASDPRLTVTLVGLTSIVHRHLDRCAPSRDVGEARDSWDRQARSIRDVNAERRGRRGLGLLRSIAKRGWL